MTSSDQSALFPSLIGGATTDWFGTLARVLGRIRESDALEVPEHPAPIHSALFDRVRAVVAEAWDVSETSLRELLERYQPEINGLSGAFGLEAEVLLGALGHGWLPGGPEVDAEIGGARVGMARLRGITASASVTVSGGDARTLLIAATDVRGEYGPARLEAPQWTDAGIDDVWLCAVTPSPDRGRVARSLLERCLPHAGVAHVEVSLERQREADMPGSAIPAEFYSPAVVARVQIRGVSSDVDADLVVGRIEGWRQAIERVVLGEVRIVWVGP